MSKFGDSLEKLARVQPLTEKEIGELRLIANALQPLIGLASRISPLDGSIDGLNAGAVYMDRTGLRVGNTFIINQDGVVIRQDADRIKWRKTLGGTTRAYLDSTIDESSVAELHLVVDGDAAWDNMMRLRVMGTTSDGAQIRLHSDETVALIDFMVMTDSTQHYVLYLLCDQAKFEDVIKIKERGASVADTVNYGQLWVKDDNPNILRYTDGDGTEFIVDMTAV